jgi:hypothetical protein
MVPLEPLAPPGHVVGVHLLRVVRHGTSVDEDRRAGQRPDSVTSVAMPAQDPAADPAGQDAGPEGVPLPDHGDVWYVSYGSNMSADRLAVYLEGGKPPGGRRENPGARDSSPPRRSVPVDLPGALFFAGDSRQWGGGVAFYDHDATAPGQGGPTAARAYLVTAEQFADVAAQEMYRVPQEGDPLEEVVIGGIDGGVHRAGPGHYETLVEVGRLDGAPLLLFTAPQRPG